MSNKTILQGKNERLNNNNLDLNSILQTINNLPEAGSGTGEDLTDELLAQDMLLGDQTTKLLIAIDTLKNKVNSGSTEIEDAMVTGELTGDYVNHRVTTIGTERLRATKITGLSCNEVVTLGSEALRDCQQLVNVYLPKCTSIGAYGIGLCPKLEKAEFNSLTKINAVGFGSNTSLTKLIIRTPSVCSLTNVSAINGSAIANGTGYIYVPDDLIDSYKEATNWSTFADQIKGLSALNTGPGAEPPGYV